MQCPPGAGRTATITLDEYNTIAVAMTYNDVVAIIGGPGQLAEDYKTPGNDDVFYRWNGPGGSTVLIEFVNNAEVSKAQVGLNPPTMSLSEFLAVAPPMSYQQVVYLVGGPGTLVSETVVPGRDDTTYSWTGDGGSALVHFENNKEVAKSEVGLR